MKTETQTYREGFKQTSMCQSNVLVWLSLALCLRQRQHHLLTIERVLKLVSGFLIFLVQK